MTKDDQQTTSTGYRGWSSRHRWIWLVIVVVALALRAGIAYRAVSTGYLMGTSGDTEDYVNTAINIADHGISSKESTQPPRPDAVRTPGYPLFLLFFYKITGTVGAAVVWGQVVLDLMILVLLGLIAKELFGARAGLLAMAAYALDFGAAAYSSMLLSETLSAFVLILAFMCLRRALDSGDKRCHLLTGILMGLAILVRPFFLLVPPALLLVWGLSRSRRRRWKEAMCLVVGLVVVVGPWSARNMVLWGTPQISSLGGATAWVYNVASLRATRDGLPPDTAVRQCQDEAAPLLLPGPENNFANSRVMFRLAMHEFARNPLLTAVLWVKGMMHALLGPSRGYWVELWPEGPIVRGWLALAALWFATVVLAAIGLFKALRARSTPAWYLVGLIAIALFTAGIQGYARFRVPVDWAICILAGAAVINGGGRKRQTAEAQRTQRTAGERRTMTTEDECHGAERSR